MNERLLQYIWQFQHFNKTDLQTTTGEPVQVLFPGSLNTNQGPDFLDAKLNISGTIWVGSIELHIHATDWHKHGHGTDENYRNVILHVVWKDDVEAGNNEKPLQFPTLELSERVPKVLLDRYEMLMDLSTFIPCHSSLSSVNELTWGSWNQRLVIERMFRKVEMVMKFQFQNKAHWEETCWWLLARNFGSHVNMDAFEAMARSISLTILGRQKKQLLQLEALMLGQAGLLNGRFKEAYPKLLQKEYHFQRSKHKLRPILMPIHFLRMRPGNFPTIRLAQLAMLIHQTENLFSFFRDADDMRDLRKTFDIVANDYWHYHYRFDEEGNFKVKKLGQSMIDSIIVNTVAPILFAYGVHFNEQVYKDKALSFLEQLSAEDNRVTKLFAASGVPIKNAADSQAVLELKSEYCDTRRCLDCAIGNAILKPPVIS